MSRPCLLYLSPGPNASLPWGGLHVTVVGRCPTGAGATASGLRDAARAVLASPEGGPPLFPASTGQWQPKLTTWRIGRERLWVIDFARSTPLDAFSIGLACRGVENVKGPLLGNSHFHVTLPSSIAGDAETAQTVLAALVSPATDWGLFLVEELKEAADASGIGGKYEWTEV